VQLLLPMHFKGRILHYWAGMFRYTCLAGLRPHPRGGEAASRCSGIASGALEVGFSEVWEGKRMIG
jgi:hypothetical protein